MDPFTLETRRKGRSRHLSWGDVATLAALLGAVLCLSTRQTPACRADGPATADRTVRVEIQTDKGSIEVELERRKAPATTANFLRYVDGGFYAGGCFHRTVTPANQPASKIKIEVIQGGPNPDRAKEEFQPIRLERTRDTGLSHKDGTISMARDGPDTATLDFFICIGAQPELDFGGRRNPDGQGFAAFGRVTKGMDVVRKIQGSPAEGQALTPAVRILKVKRVGPWSGPGAAGDVRPRFPSAPPAAGRCPPRC